MQKVSVTSAKVIAIAWLIWIVLFQMDACGYIAGAQGGWPPEEMADSRCEARGRCSFRQRRSWEIHHSRLSWACYDRSILTWLEVNLALALTSHQKKVGLLDADLFGPSIPKMMNLQSIQPTISNSGSSIFLKPSTLILPRKADSAPG